eukprot:7257567-Lingulodinium_polyedra.AAC.1
MSGTTSTNARASDAGRWAPNQSWKWIDCGNGTQASPSRSTTLVGEAGRATTGGGGTSAALT